MIAGYSADTWQRAFPVRAQRRVRPKLVTVPHETGVLERRNPLPVAKYWKDIFEADAEAFGAWLRDNQETVKVRTTEHIDGDPPRDWILFEVTSPTMWDGPGYPDVAAPDVHSSADTVQRPAPEKDPLDKLDAKDPLGLKSAVPWIVAGVAVVATIAVLKS